MVFATKFNSYTGFHNDFKTTPYSSDPSDKRNTRDYIVRPVEGVLVRDAG